MTQKNDHREAPAIANWSVWGVAMVAAAAFSVALGNLAGDIVRNQGLPAGFLAQIEASREDSTWAQKCPDGTRGVAINNYPGTQNLLGGTHSTYYTKSGERNWRCSHICVPQESASNLNNYLKDAKVDGKPLIVLAGPAQFNEYFKEGAEGQDGPEAAMTRAIILSSTKTSCVGPNSVDYGEIKTANKDEIKKEERIGTAAPAEATATTDKTAAERIAEAEELAEKLRQMTGTRTAPTASGPAAPAAGESEEFSVGVSRVELSEEATKLQKQLRGCVIAVTRLAGDLGYAKLSPSVERASKISNNFRESGQRNIIYIADPFLRIFELAQHKRDKESLINKKDPSKWTSQDIQNAKSAFRLCEQVRRVLEIVSSQKKDEEIKISVTVEGSVAYSSYGLDQYDNRRVTGHVGETHVCVALAVSKKETCTKAIVKNERGQFKIQLPTITTTRRQLEMRPLILLYAVNSKGLLRARNFLFTYPIPTSNIRGGKLDYTLNTTSYHKRAIVLRGNEENATVAGRKAASISALGEDCLKKRGR